MRICFLLLAHASPRLFERLVHTVTGAGDRVVVHVDSKSDQGAFVEKTAKFGNVVFVENRIDVKWGSWSMLRAEIEMMRVARNRYPGCDYYWVLSADSYPVRSMSAIHSYLAVHAGSEFINFAQMPAPSFAKPLERISHRHFDYDIRSGRYRKIFILASKMARRPYAHMLGGRVPYGGSQWVTLTGAAVDTLLAAADSDLPL